MSTSVHILAAWEVRDSRESELSYFFLHCRWQQFLYVVPCACPNVLGHIVVLYVTKQYIYIICAEANTNNDDEGYGSTVVCKNCSERSNDEPPIKKTLDWAIKYPPKSDTLKHKKPQLKSANKPRPNRLFEREKRCICLTCLRDGQDRSI